jgi:hypothetical protein
MPHSIKIRGIEPPDYAGLSSALRQQFWSLVTPIALRVKDQELAQGLDAKGEPLKPIRPRTRKYRKSAMTPSGKGDPSAPPLMPAHQKSRVRSLLAGRAFPTHCELYWRYDPFTGASFDEILSYQKAKGRDVFGISKDGLRKIRIQSWAAWTKWKKKGLEPTKDRTAVASHALQAGPQTRIARIIAESAKPRATPVAVAHVGSYDMTTAETMSGAKVRAGQWTGGMTGGGWHRWATAEVKGKGQGPGPQILQVQPPRPKPPKPKAPPKAPVKAPLPKPPLPPPKPPQPKTFTSELERIGTMVLSGERQAAIAQLVEQHATAAGTHTTHGMTNPEEFRAIDYAGSRWFFAPGTEAKLAEGLDQLMINRQRLPDRLIESTREYWFCTQDNKLDPYWRQRYQNFQFSNATGGDGNVMVYRQGSLMLRTISHEAGHNLATRLYGTTKPAKDYQKAIDTGESPVSEYARNSPSEDFAEACRVYVMESWVLKKNHPERYAVIHKLMTDSTYGG